MNAPASTATIRAAIYDVVDGSAFYVWMWDKDDEDNANRTREEFVDAVIRRIGEIQKLRAKESNG